ncbi:MAG: SDR family NAD(P)-dependent oxidoreductase [Acidimicrobiia bacterium]
MSDPDPLFDLTGKVAVVTGGSRGLGRAMSFAFAGHGATVVVASRKADACRATAEEITAASGQKALGLGCHVGHWEECDRLVEAVYAECGRVDVLVNNAGSSPLYPSIAEVSEDLFDKVLAVNLKGPFRLASLVGTRMAEGDGGSIVNVSSVAAVMPSESEIPYAAAKAALNNLTKSLARALAPTVRVNCIMAGPFMTDISKAWGATGAAEALPKTVPLGRGGEADEIVGAALYLASAASSFTTGSILKVDGGLAFSSG